MHLHVHVNRWISQRRLRSLPPVSIYITSPDAPGGALWYVFASQLASQSICRCQTTQALVDGWRFIVNRSLKSQSLGDVPWKDSMGFLRNQESVHCVHNGEWAVGTQNSLLSSGPELQDFAEFKRIQFTNPRSPGSESSLGCRRSRVVTFTAIRLRGPRFKLQIWKQNFSGGEGVSPVQGEAN